MAVSEWLWSWAGSSFLHWNNGWITFRQSLCVTQGNYISHHTVSALGMESGLQSGDGCRVMRRSSAQGVLLVRLLALMRTSYASRALDLDINWTVVRGFRRS